MYRQFLRKGNRQETTRIRRAPKNQRTYLQDTICEARQMVHIWAAAAAATRSSPRKERWGGGEGENADAGRSLTPRFIQVHTTPFPLLMQGPRIIYRGAKAAPRTFTDAKFGGLFFSLLYSAPVTPAARWWLTFFARCILLSSRLEDRAGEIFISRFVPCEQTNSSPSIGTNQIRMGNAKLHSWKLWRSLIFNSTRQFENTSRSLYWFLIEKSIFT